MEGFEILTWETFIGAVGLDMPALLNLNYHMESHGWYYVGKWTTANYIEMQFSERYHIGCSISKPSERFSFWSISRRSGTFVRLLFLRPLNAAFSWGSSCQSTLSHADGKLIFLFEMSNRNFPNYFCVHGRATQSAKCVQYYFILSLEVHRSVSLVCTTLVCKVTAMLWYEICLLSYHLSFFFQLIMSLLSTFISCETGVSLYTLTT